jgi:hypothetical protein
MSEPRTRRRGTWWVVAGLLVTFLALGLRVGVPIYRRKQAIEDIERIGGHVEFGALPDYPGVPNGWLRACSSVNGIRSTWLVRFERFMRDSSLPECQEETRQRARVLIGNLPEFGELKSLDLALACLEDADLADLAGLRNLEMLDLSNTPLSGTGLKSLGRLARLERLDLSGTDVDDYALKYVAELSNLRFLQLDRAAAES